MQCNKFQFLNIEIAINRNKHLYKQFYALICKRELFRPKFPVLYFHKLVHLYSLSKGSKLKSQQQPKRHQWVIKQTNNKIHRDYLYSQKLGYQLKSPFSVTMFVTREIQSQFHLKTVTKSPEEQSTLNTARNSRSTMQQ